MARGINKVILIGNLGQDPETRLHAQRQGRHQPARRHIESWKDKQTGEQQERTEWHSVAMFDRLAEIAAEYLRKGSQVYIEGKLRTRKWQDKEGQDRYTTEISPTRCRCSAAVAVAAQEPNRAPRRVRRVVAASTPSPRPRPHRAGMTPSTTTFRSEAAWSGSCLSYTSKPSVAR